MPLAKDVHTASTTAHRERSTAVGTERAASRPSWEADAETHLIRLCLDLQLDAMLLALGAASAHARRATSSGPAGPADAPTDSPPWDRWVLEDVEMVCTLAADVMSGGAALPATLGSDLDQAVPAAAVDNLVARYESMATLLADILPPDATRSPAPYRAHAQEALARCQERLRELRATRLEQTPPRGLPLASPAEHPPVPGEWLG